MNDRSTPIALFAFRRPETTVRTLQALERCDEFHGRPVYLFCDGPREKVADEYRAVEEVREVLRKWAIGKSAECCFSDRNQGLRPSILAGVSAVLREHGTVIVLEDDIVVSRSFLRYMQQSLDQFLSHENVWQVSGYFPPSLRMFPRSGFLRVPACWGWGTWESRWAHYRDDALQLQTQVALRGVDRFNIEQSYDFFGELTANVEARIDTWHIRWYASMFLKDALALYPGRSLTRNIGFDSDGSNCHAGRMGEVYATQPISDRLPRLPRLPQLSSEACESAELVKAIIRFHHWQQAVWTEQTLMDRVRRRWKRLVGTGS
jgi:hypothetical protein